LARQGKPVQKPSRSVVIHSLTIRSLDPPDVSFAVCCSAGTYIRSLCVDIGRQIGCGAHLKTLERTRSSDFHLKQALSLEELEAQTREGRLADLVLPCSHALPHLPAITADKVLTEKIKYGRMIRLTDLLPSQTKGRQGLLKIVDAQDQLLAIVELMPNGVELPYRGVFMA
jgi:tRNA pseudouridine55 synthase